MAAPPTPPPNWGVPPPLRPYVAPGPGRAQHRSSANLLLVAAALHVVAAIISWLVVPVLVANAPSDPGIAELLYAVAIVGVGVQLTFAAMAGLGFAFVSRGGASVVGAGTALLVIGIVAAIVSLFFGGLLGLIAGVLTAYTGNKVRKPPMPRWIPPTSWMPPPQPPTPPRSP